MNAVTRTQFKQSKLGNFNINFKLLTLEGNFCFRQPSKERKANNSESRIFLHVRIFYFCESDMFIQAFHFEITTNPHAIVKKYSNSIYHLFSFSQ